MGTTYNSRLTEEQKSELDKRYADYKNGIGVNYSWEEVVKVSDKAIEQQIKLRKLNNSDTQSAE